MASSEPQQDATSLLLHLTSLLHPDPHDDVFGPTDLDAVLFFGPMDDIDEIERPSQAAAVRPYVLTGPRPLRSSQPRRLEGTPTHRPLRRHQKLQAVPKLPFLIRAIARKPRDSTSAACTAVATAEMVWEGTADSELRAAGDNARD
ncbi:hypothetical protein LTR29_009033 [Friedmanniomyces endolithicus]|nr:hypothetical protein LTR29_009033 [Friedmanniomyces endolithicus]